MTSTVLSCIDKRKKKGCDRGSEASGPFSTAGQTEAGKCAFLRFSFSKVNYGS